MSQNVIVISIEGLSTTQVGAYGSNTSQTKSIDSIAARGIVLDQCFLDSRDSIENLKSLWTATHAITRSHSTGQSERSETSSTIWTGLQADAGVFVTDCPRAAELAESSGCSRVVLVESQPADAPAEEVSQCEFYSLLAAAAETLEHLNELTCETKLLWIHSRGLRLPWDAPSDLRSRFKDADDPDPPTELGPPLFPVDASTDPDVVLGWSNAAAAQVMVIDEGVEFLKELMDQFDDPWAWCFVGLNAFPLGEHGWVGDGGTPLNNHQLQVVGILSPQPVLPIGWRVDGVCQLPDIGSSIAQMCGIDLNSLSIGNTDEVGRWGESQLQPPNDQPPVNWESRYQSAVLVESEAIWLRAPAWSMRIDANQSISLFVQPDDHWEVNEVGSRCSDVIEELQAACNQFMQAAKMGSRDALAKLNEVSCNLLR